MLQTRKIRENKAEYIKLLKVKNFDANNIFNLLIDLDDQRKEAQIKCDELLSKSNNLSSQIGKLYKTGDTNKVASLKKESIIIKDESKIFLNKQNKLEREIKDLLVQIPNIPHPSVPAGKSDSDNLVLKQQGEAPALYDGAKPHWDLTERYGLIDFGLGNKITGSGFPVYTNKGAKLQRALISYFLDKNINAGYLEYLPPLLVNEASGFGTGSLPDKEGQMYHVNEDNLYLIPTAEVPVTNFFRDIIVKHILLALDVKLVHMVRMFVV